MICLSHFLNKNTPGFGGSQTDVVITPLSKIADGASSNSLRIEMKNHVGTHVDLPSHFDQHGKTLSDYSSGSWIFEKPQLLELICNNDEILNLNRIEGLIAKDTDILIIRTQFERFRSEEKYWKHNPGIEPKVGRWLRENCPFLRAVGFDFISLTSLSNREIGREAHRAFLGPHGKHEPILIIEDMKLSELQKTPEKIIVAPLMIENADGVPVTVFAF